MSTKSTWYFGIKYSLIYKEPKVIHVVFDLVILSYRIILTCIDNKNLNVRNVFQLDIVDHIGNLSSWELKTEVQEV